MPKHSTKVVNITTGKGFSLPQEVGNESDAAFYLLDAAIDSLEAAFSNPKTHEEVLGRKNIFYVSPETLPTIFHLLYEAKDKARFVRDQIAFLRNTRSPTGEPRPYRRGFLLANTVCRLVRQHRPRAAGIARKAQARMLEARELGPAWRNRLWVKSDVLEGDATGNGVKFNYGQIPGMVFHGFSRF